MKLTLAEPKYLKDSVSIISELVTEARFKVTSNSMELVAMDPANVAMVIFNLLSSCFTEYKLEKDIEIAINLSNLKQVLRRAKQNDNLTLEMDDNKLKITMKNGSTRTFSLPLIAIEEKEQKVPELNFPVEIKTTSTILNEAIEDVDIVAESVTFQTDSKKLEIFGQGDLSKAKVDIASDENTKITSSSKDKIQAKYSIEYLKKMIGGSKLADEVTLQFNKDYPLKIQYNVVDKMQLSFILAPRVEND